MRQANAPKRTSTHERIPDVLFFVFSLLMWVGFALLMYLGNPARHVP